MPPQTLVVVMVVLCAIGAVGTEAEQAAVSNIVAQIAFGSCNRPQVDQRYWERMEEILEDQRAGLAGSGTAGRSGKADAFIWLGDAIYRKDETVTGSGVPGELQDLFAAQRNSQHYLHFREEATERVLGVWDDHDMGVNNVGKEFPYKKEVQQHFLDFLGIPDADPRREREGLYHLEEIPFANPTAPLSEHYHFAVCVVLLDLRYHRDPLSRRSDGDMLGDAQWEWLEGVAAHLGQRVPAGSGSEGRGMCAVTLIGSSVQFLMDEKPTEGWDLFPKSRDRLLHLLRRHRVERTLFLSGDVHLGEIGVDNTTNAQRTLGYPVVDITSSGLTHTIGDFPFVRMVFHRVMASPRRVGAYLNRNFGTVLLVERPASHDEVAAVGLAPMGRQAVDVVLTIHSLVSEEHGDAVLYRFPLSMLTYAAHAHHENGHRSVSEGDSHVVPFATAPYPLLKQLVLATGCVALPCLNGKGAIILRILLELVKAFVFLLSVLLLCVAGIAAKRRCEAEKNKAE